MNLKIVLLSTIGLWGADGLTAAPGSVDKLQEILDAGQQRVAQNEARKVPCSPEQTVLVEQARVFVRVNLDAIWSAFEKTRLLDKACKPLKKDQFSRDFGRAMVYCPVQEAENSTFGVVIEMPGEQYSYGAYGLFPGTFVSSCELVDSIIHEEGHLISRSYHTFSSVGQDAPYLFGAAAHKICDEQGFSVGVK